jgi:hypothetical protein
LLRTTVLASRMSDSGRAGWQQQRCTAHHKYQHQPQQQPPPPPLQEVAMASKCSYRQLVNCSYPFSLNTPFIGAVQHNVVLLDSTI